MTRIGNWLDRARTALDRHPANHLVLGYRRAVLGALGPTDPSSSPLANEGHRRRALLAIASARKTLPIWCQHRPEDRLVGSILADAERGLGEPVKRGTIERKLESYSEEIDRRLKDQVIEALAPDGALYALAKVIDDFATAPEEVDFSISDEDLDYHEIDGHFVAAAVFSGGVPGEVGSDPGRRLEFWLWWLDEAVPAAYRDGSLG